MRTGATLDPGFYWVSVDALPPEVARRDAEAGEWVLVGQESGIADGERVKVLSGSLPPPGRLKDRICHASWLAARARVDLDLFDFLTREMDNAAAALESRRHPNRFGDALVERWSLFEAVRTAHEHAFMARIANLFAGRRQKDTDNFPDLVDEAVSAGAISAATRAAIKAQITAADGAYQAVKKVRDKVVSHQDAIKTKAEIYAEAQLTLPMLIKLSEQSRAIAAALCSALGVQPQAVFTEPVEQLEAMLAELQPIARTFGIQSVLDGDPE